jgi:hypothetical protein
MEGVFTTFQLTARRFVDIDAELAATDGAGRPAEWVHNLLCEILYPIASTVRHKLHVNKTVLLIFLPFRRRGGIILDLGHAPEELRRLG